MARKKKHEEHVNAEAWAIPYGDLVTLLFALFTVMYAMSSVNEGKFRVLSDSMIAAFHGAPKSMQPVNVGEKQVGKGGDKQLVGVSPTALMKLKDRRSAPGGDPKSGTPGAEKGSAREDVPGALLRMQRQVQDAMKSLIDAKMVTVRRENMWLEIEINTDILFPSGAGAFSAAAAPVLDKLAQVLQPFPNPIRVEGHTDDRPIRTAAFPSNWELSAARAASVVHEFTKVGIDPLRLEIVGFGEFHPRQPNDSAEGRNANRRVAILVLEEVAGSAAVTAKVGAQTSETAAEGAAKAGAGGTANQLVSGLPPADVDKTVLVKDQAKAEEPARLRPPAQHIGPVELVWPGKSEVKAPTTAQHE
jgi:chemotaxis protein MotB